MLEFATGEQQVGQAIVASLANARLVPAGGVALPAIFNRTATDVPIGSNGMQARITSASCLSSELPEHVVRGAQCALYYDDQLFLRAGLFEVRKRDDDLETGIARLDLQLIEA